MAKLTKLPDKSIIDGLKGSLDFYTLHLNPTLSEGIHCCRSWPRFDPEKLTEASKAAAAVFGYISSLLSSLPDNLVQAYRSQTSGTRLTWRDLAIRSYLNGDMVYPRSTTLDDWWLDNE